MIAMAIANDPDLLIADEPTTALDVTIQARDPGIASPTCSSGSAWRSCSSPTISASSAGFADRVYVMQSGAVVEEGETDAIFDHPRDPYTRDAAGGGARGPQGAGAARLRRAFSKAAR